MSWPNFTRALTRTFAGVARFQRAEVDILSEAFGRIPMASPRSRQPEFTGSETDRPEGRVGGRRSPIDLQSLPSSVTIDCRRGTRNRLLTESRIEPG